MSNIKKPASSTAKVKKLLLFEGDPLIKTLKPDYYVVVGDNSLKSILDPVDNLDSGEDFDGFEFEDPEDPYVNNLKAPSLSDITLVSKTMITDKNKNQYVEFVFNVKNSGGDTVVGAEIYGQ
jgi:hypothetical protein